MLNKNYGLNKIKTVIPHSKTILKKAKNNFYPPLIFMIEAQPKCERKKITDLNFLSKSEVWRQMLCMLFVQVYLK